MKKRLIFLLIGLLTACGVNDNTPAQPTFTPEPATVEVNRQPATPTPRFSGTIPPTDVLPAEVNLNPDEPARLRFVQANPELEVVDIYMNNAAVAPRFRPGSYSSSPVDVPSGPAILRVMPAGRPPGSQEALFEGQLELQPFQNMVIYFYGTADSILLETYEIDLTPLENETTRLYAIHAIPNGPAVNVVANGETLAQELVYGEQTDPAELPAGDYEIELNTGGSRTLATLQETLQEKQVYTLLMMGDITTNEFSTVIFSEPATPQTLVRLVHASFDTPAVRVFLDDELLVEDFAYQEFTPEFLQVESGRHRIRVEAMDALEGDPPLVDETVVLTPDGQVDLLLYDQFVDLKVGQFNINTEPTPAGQARLSVIHTLPALPQVTVLIPTVISGESGAAKEFQLAFGNAMLPQIISTGAQSYQFLADDVLLTRTDELMIEPGNTYTYILMGRRLDGLLLTTPVGESDAQATTTVTETDAGIRFVNSLSDGETLTVRVNDEVFAENLASGESSAPYSIGEGEIAVEIQTDSERLSQTFQALTGENLTILITGTAASPEIFSFTDPTEAFFAGRARLRFLNTLPTTVNPLLKGADEDTAALIGLPMESDDLLVVGSNPMETGSILVTDLPPGDYILMVDTTDGERLYEAPLEIETDLFYDMVITEAAGEVEILKIPTTPD